MAANYLSYKFDDSEAFINTFDEAPLWSAAFGLLLLKHLEQRKGITVLDIGSGSGFPLMELAGRLGSTSACYGLDPWKNANERARTKVKNYGLDNVQILEGTADQIPLKSNTIDLIVSNLGINNFEHPNVVFSECCRILKQGGKLALTTNVNGHWQEFYYVFQSTLQQLGKNDIVEKLTQQQLHRGDVNSISSMFTENGYKVTRCFEDSFVMQFADGSAFLNHYFVKLGWLSSWTELIPQPELETVFTTLEHDLNIAAQSTGSLRLTVPMLYIEGEKV